MSTPSDDLVLTTAARALRRALGPTAESRLELGATSRPLRRSFGPTAWVVLEELCLEATFDADGVVVAATNVRALASQLDVNKDTVARALSRLIAAGVLVRRSQRDAAHRFGPVVYELHLPDGLRLVPRPEDADTGSAVTPQRRNVGRRPEATAQLSLLDLVNRGDR